MKPSFYKFGKQKPPRRAERGLVLIITLLVMVAMLLVSTALMRSTDTSVQVVNNLSFRQAAEASSNIAVERAMVVINAIVTGGAIPSNCPTNSSDGFYPSKQPNESPEGIPNVLLGPFPLGGNVCVIPVSDMTVSFIVEPMCADPAAGMVASNCMFISGPTGSVVNAQGVVVGNGTGNNTDGGGEVVVGGNNPNPSGGGGGAGGGAAPNGVPIYRVSMRVDGAKNTTIFAQAFVN